MTDDDLKRMIDVTVEATAQRIAEENRRQMAVFTESVTGEVQRAAEENRRQMAAFTESLTDRVDRAAEENRRQMAIFTESVKHDVQLVAEAVATLREDVTRDIDDLRENTERGFEETQAMIKFSHAELERRVRSLEQSFADLQARVERLETRPH